MKIVRLLALSAALLFSCGSPATSSSTFSASSSSEEATSSKQESLSSVSSSESEATSSATSSNSSVISSASSAERQERDPMGEPLLGRQYYLNHIGDIFSVWGQYRGRGVTIAVIDVGFNPDHEDFVFADGSSKVSPLSASFVTDTSGKTTTEVGTDKVVNMGESHGTFCAGVAAAGANGKGVVGVAPEASLLLLKTDLKPKSIAKAFTYAADNGAKVVTISIGSYYDYGGDLIDDGSDLGTVFDAPVKYCYDKGIPVISAGGNGGEDGKPTEFTFPGCVDHVIGVGGLAANSSTEIWTGSSYNSSPEWQSIDVLAPAERMYGCCHYDGKSYDGWEWKGTSFASPIVAGMAALYFEANPTKGAVDFEHALFDSCHALTTSKIARADQLGYGRVDVGALLGIQSKGNVTAKLKASWGSGYAYCWNSLTGKSMSAWPGTKLTSSGGTFTVTVDSSKYDSIIFTQSNNGPQTVDLALSSFVTGKTLDVSAGTKDNGFLIGTYR